MPQIIKEQANLQQKDRKPALSLLFPCRLSMGFFSQQSCSRDGSQVMVALLWSICHQRSFQPSCAALGHGR